MIAARGHRRGHGVAAAALLTCLLSWIAPASGDELVVEKTAYAEDTDAPQRDGFAALLEYEASVCLAEGKLERASYLLERLVKVQPDNTPALRELGRVTAALGDSARASRILSEVDRRQGRSPDPELHFILGEALLALGERSEGLATLERAAEEIALAPASVRTRMWLARILALRGEAEQAALIYRELTPSERQSPMFEAVYLGMAEAHIIGREWQAAEDVLKTFLAAYPGHERARDMLGWVLESRGDVGAEVKVRGALAADLSTRPGDYTAAHARALERSHQYRSALAQYRRAAWLGVDVDLPIERLDGRLSPEVVAAASVLSDDLGERWSTTAGVSVPLSGWARIVGTATYDRASDLELAGYGHESADLTTGQVWSIFELGQGGEIGAGGTAWRSDSRGAQVGGQALVRTSPSRWWRAYVRAEANTPWRESAATIREGGATDNVEVQLYTRLFSPRVTAMITGRARRMSLARSGGRKTMSGDQIFGAAGLDVTVHRGNGRVSRGHILDNELLGAEQIASGLVVSYRHYESRSDDPFAMRLSLVQRSSLDEGSLTFRHVLDDSGVFAVMSQGGLGFDHARDIWRWRAAGLGYVAVTPSTRVSASVEAASETTFGLTGRRVAAMLGLHVDL